MSAEPIRPNEQSPRWPRSVQLVLAFLLGGLTIGAAQRFLPIFSRPAPTQPLAKLDLNQATKPELMQLPHVSEKRADAIIAARDQRGGFTQVHDVQSAEGIGPARQRDLMPHVRVDADEQFLHGKPPSQPPSDSAPRRGKKERPTSLIDVNRADLAELQKLPGIGPVLAARIITEREKSPFTHPDDMLRVSGIGPKTMEKIRPYIWVGSRE